MTARTRGDLRGWPWLDVALGLGTIAVLVALWVIGVTS